MFLLLVLFFLPSVSSSQCILVPQPLSHPDSSTDTATVFLNDSISIITLKSEFQYSTLLHFLTDDSQENCSEIIGVIGDVDSVTARIVYTVTTRFNYSTTLVSAVSPTTFRPLTNDNIPNVLDMNPLNHYVQALISFVDQLNWTRVALVSDNTYYYQFAAELLQMKMCESGKTVVPLITLDEKPLLHQTLQTVQEYGTQIIILSLPKLTACSLLDEAQRVEFNWPNYGWLLLDIESIIVEATCEHEGVIKIKDFSIKQYGKSLMGQKILGENILFDSINAVALASDNIQISSASFEGRTGHVQFTNGNRLNNISFVQMMNGSESVIGEYVSDTDELMLSSKFLNHDKPRGSILIIRGENTIQHTISFAIIILLCLAFVTVILILYILFRNEPEIKATSVPISLSMFLGCYLQLLFVPILLVKAYPDSRVAVPHSDSLAWWNKHSISSNSSYNTGKNATSLCNNSKAHFLQEEIFYQLCSCALRRRVSKSKYSDPNSLVIN